MLKNIHHLFIIVPLIVWGIFIAILNFPTKIYILLAIANILIFLTVFIFYKRSTIKGGWWNYLVFPFTLVNCLISYSVLVNQKILLHSLFIIGALLIYWYLKLVFLFLNKPSFYRPSSLENLSLYGNFLVVFLLFASLFGWQSFINTPIWAASLIALFFVVLINYQSFWSNKIPFKRAGIFILVNSLLLIELFWVATFLPFNFNISGFLLALCYYLTLGPTRLHLLGKLNKKEIKIFLSVSAVSILLILLTSQWI